jgi:DNA-binding NarL/FixJ family response regulator
MCELTPRQQQVLRELLIGRTEKDAAANLGISAHTLHVHVRSIYRAYGVHSRSQLMGLWIMAGDDLKDFASVDRRASGCSDALERKV